MAHLDQAISFFGGPISTRRDCALPDLQQRKDDIKQPAPKGAGKSKQQRVNNMSSLDIALFGNDPDLGKPSNSQPPPSRKAVAKKRQSNRDFSFLDNEKGNSVGGVVTSVLERENAMLAKAFQPKVDRAKAAKPHAANGAPNDSSFPGKSQHRHQQPQQRQYGDSGPGRQSGAMSSQPSNARTAHASRGGPSSRGPSNDLRERPQPSSGGESSKRREVAAQGAARQTGAHGQSASRAPPRRAPTGHVAPPPAGRSQAQYGPPPSSYYSQPQKQRPPLRNMFGSKLVEPTIKRKKSAGGGYWDDDEDDSFIDDGDLGEELGPAVDSDWRREMRGLTKYDPTAYRDEGFDDRQMAVWNFGRIQAEEKHTAKIGREEDRREEELEMERMRKKQRRGF